MFLIIISFLMPIVINCYVCPCLLVDSCRMTLKPGSMAISVSVAEKVTLLIQKTKNLLRKTYLCVTNRKACIISCIRVFTKSPLERRASNGCESRMLQRSNGPRLVNTLVIILIHMVQLLIVANSSACIHSFAPF